ncbi:hypothetical protein PIB30_096181, partial [Stylosanthes scabra]|nr:hypothetical protein [Stylosanthes scabra]
FAKTPHQFPRMWDKRKKKAKRTPEDRVKKKEAKPKEPKVLPSSQNNHHLSQYHHLHLHLHHPSHTSPPVTPPHCSGAVVPNFFLSSLPLPILNRGFFSPPVHSTTALASPLAPASSANPETLRALLLFSISFSLSLSLSSTSTMPLPLLSHHCYHSRRPPLAQASSSCTNVAAFFSVAPATSRAVPLSPSRSLNNDAATIIYIFQSPPASVNRLCPSCVAVLSLLDKPAIITTIVTLCTSYC